MSHTPGPWLLSLDTDSDGHKTGVARVYTPNHATDGWCSEYFQEADARLIAAAPELLESCKEVSLLINAGGILFMHEPWVARLRAAILKAEGPS